MTSKASAKEKPKKKVPAKKSASAVKKATPKGVKRSWEEAISKAKGPDIPYDMNGSYKTGNIVLHKTFGRGVVLEIFDKKMASMKVRAGLYQGYPTLGADLRLFIVTLNYTTYAEEVGAYAGQDNDRRHLIALNLGW